MNLFRSLQYLSMFRDKVPRDQPIMHSFMMGTSMALSPQDNVAVMSFMENEVIKLARRMKCHGILTTNTNPLTQQLAQKVYGYETIQDYQINEFESNGKKPFGSAPDSYRAIVLYKTL